jgi:Rx N-terminal domain
MVMGSSSLFSVLSTIGSLLTFIRTSSPVSGDQENHGVEDHLNQLERMLRMIRATLRDAGEREIRDELVKLWLMELEDVAFDAEDVLDEYRYVILRRQAEAREKKPDEFGTIGDTYFAIHIPCPLSTFGSSIQNMQRSVQK